ncbi:MAG TPA: ester cyclase [Rubrobacter sp.]|jgi:predicted ester cyclase|nr:ester cyclase [Rubrobacter sp.]
MSEERNKAVVRRFYEEVFNAGRLEVMDELASPDLVAHDTLPPGVPERGPEPYKHTTAMFRSALPDLHQEIEDMVAEEDTVAVRVTLTATHRGPFLGVEPTGRRCATGAWTSSVSGKARWSSTGPPRTTWV